MFGGGMARQGYVCGAAVGGLMVLGLRYGYVDPNPDEKSFAFDKAGGFLTRFRQENGAINCRDLLGLDLSIPEVVARAKEEGVFSRVCSKIIENTINTLGSMLYEKT